MHLLLSKLSIHCTSKLGLHHGMHIFSLSRCSMSSYQSSYDVIVVGGGIVGLATAREILLRHPQKRIALLEKEREIGNFDNK